MSDADAAAHAPSRRPDGQQRLRNYWLLIRADRPIGIYLLLWPALWALWIAGAGEPTWWVVLIFVLGTALMRSAGCAINDYADREFDGLVERTKGRPLVNGLVTPGEALGVFVVLSLAAFGLVLLLNSKTVAQSFVAVGLAALYPFTKRITPLPQLFLGLAFGWAVPMAFTALQNAIPPVAWVLLLATVTWAVIYDTMYAMVDRDDDVRIGVKSTAILFGRFDRLVIGALQVLMMGMMLLVGHLAGLGEVYYLGLAVAAGFFIYQQYLIRNRERALCFRAFLNNHYFGMTLFAALLLDYLTA